MGTVGDPHHQQEPGGKPAGLGPEQPNAGHHADMGDQAVGEGHKQGLHGALYATHYMDQDTLALQNNTGSCHQSALQD